MKYLFIIATIFFVGCKAAGKSGDKSYFGADHAPYLDAPAVFIAAAESDVQSTSIALDWAPSKGADEYMVDYKSHTSTTWTTATTVKTPHHIITGLHTNTAYDFKIRAKNLVGITDSNVMTISTLADSSTPTVSRLAAVTMTEGVQQIVTLPYSSPNNALATSCEITGEVNVDVTRNCQCDNSGICTVGVTPDIEVSSAGSFNYRILISQNSSSWGAVSFWANAVNDAPEISTLASLTSNEDTTTSVDFTITDVDSTLQCSSSYLSATSSNSALLDANSVTFSGTAPNCTATLNPIHDANGTTNITIIVSDGALYTTSNTMTWTVLPVNDMPVMSPLVTLTTNENTPKSTTFTISDVDSVLTCAGSVSATSSNPTLVHNAGIVISGTAPNCLMTILPELNQNGQTQITMNVTDGIATLVSTFTLTVDAVNTAPTLSFISNATTNEDVPAAINFTIGDVDSTIACSSSYLSAASSNSSLLLDMDITFSGTYPNCTATLRPLANKSGTSNITFSLTDGSLVTTSNAFSLTVNAVNDAPTISHILPQIGPQDVVKSVSFTIDDIDSTLTCNGSVTGASSDTTIIANTGIAITGTYPNCSAAITPITGKSGSVDITLTVSDGALSSTSNFAMTLTSVNQAPTISSVSNFSMNEDTPSVVNFTINDPDSTLGCSSSYLSATSSNSAIINASSIVFGGTYPNCTATINPILDQSGTASVTLSVSDGSLTATTPAFTVTLNAVDDPAVISPILTQNIALNTPAIVTMNITDVDSTIDCSTSLTGTSSNTNLVANNAIIFSGVAPACIATVNPTLNQTGVTTITISAGSAASSFTMTFGLTTTPSVASNINPASFNEDTQSLIPLSYDVQNALASSCFVSSTNHVTVTTPCSCDVNGLCKVGVTGTSYYNGSAGFTYNVTANNMVSNSATASFTINAVNNAPTISSIIAQSTPEDTAKVVNFTINDVDSTLTCAGSVTATSSNSTLVSANNISISGTAPNCQATITPSLNQNDISTITFTVSDGTLNSSSIFALTVTPVNDAPSMSALAAVAGTEDTTSVVNFMINDPDSTLTCMSSVVATTSNTAIVSVADVAFGGTYPNCTATISPELNQAGAVTLTFTVSDGQLTDSKNFVMTVNAVNDAPVMSSIAAQSTNEDTSKAVNFTISDVDSTLTCAGSVSGVSSNSSLVTNNNIVITGNAPNCTATILPSSNQSGSTSVTLTVTDGSLTAQSIFSLTVTPVNDAPTMSFLANDSTNEDTAKVINFTIADVDSTLACNASYLSASSSNASLVLDTDIVFGGSFPNCTATINPLHDQNGSTNITFTVTDGSLSTVSNAFTLTVNPVNDAPVISTIMAQSTDEDTVKGVNFTIGDIDSTLTCAGSVVGTSSDTTIVPNSGIVVSGTYPNCTATVTAATNKNGSVDLTLTVSDGALSASSTFAYTITAINDAPTIAAISSQTTDEDTPLVVNFTIADIDSVLTCSGRVTATSSNGSLLTASNILITGTYPNCTATLSPLANQHGNSNITLTVTDGALSAATTFALTVNSVDDAPVVSNIYSVTVSEDSEAIISLPYTDVDNDLATSCSLSSLNNVTVTTPCSCSSGVCSAGVTGLANYNGSAGFSFTVTANGAVSNTGTASFNITAVNDAPTISSVSSQTVNEDNSLAVNFTINDVDSVLTCSGKVSAASSAPAIVPATNVVITGTYPNCIATITPIANANGAANITLTVTDGLLNSTSSFALTVTPVDDAPVASNVTSVIISEDTQAIIALPYSDIDGDFATACTISSLSHVTVTSACSCTAGICTVGVTGTTDYNGAAGFNFSVMANSAVSNIALASFSITAVNDAPTISTIASQSVNEDNVLTVNFTIADVDSVLTCAGKVSAASSVPAIIPASSIVISGTFPNCVATLTPLANKNGPATITLTVTDGALSNSSAFSLTVNPVDDPPVATNIASATVSEDVQAIITLPYSDVDGDLATSCTVSNLSHVTITNACSCTAGVCSVGVTGTADYNGAAGFSFAVTANSIVSNTATASFSITAVNDAPTMAAITSQSVDEDSAVAVNFTIADVDSALTCAGSVSGVSSNLTNLVNANIVITGTAPNCVATITPVANKNGSTNVTLTVTDGSLTAARTFALTINPVLDIGGGLAMTGTADSLYTKSIDFTGLTIDEAVSKVEVCIAEDTNLNGIISAGEECNTQTWIDITSSIGASGSTSTSGWSSYVIKNGKDGASFISNLAPSCSSNRNYATEIRMTNSVGNKTTVVSAIWNFWNPTCISSKLGLWLDASDSATIFSNTACSTPAVSGVANGVLCWKDKSQNGYSYNATATTNPKLLSNGWSGNRPAMIFNGANDLYKNGISVTPRNIISAVKVNVNDNLDGLIGNTTADFGVRIDAANTWLSTGLGALTNDFAYQNGQTYINGALGNNHALAENLLYVTKGDSTFSSYVTWTGVGIGGYYSLLGIPDRRINANVGEIIMCTTDCSSSQTKLEGYIAHKWGLAGNLPANHAYKTSAP